MTILIDQTKQSPDTRFMLEGDLLSQSIAGNYSVVRMYLAANNAGTTSSQFLGFGAQGGRVNGVEFGRRQGEPFLPPGYNYGARRWRIGPYDVKVYHRADGTAPKGLGGGAWGVEVQMHLTYGNVADAYSADITLPTIARATQPSFSPNPADAGSPITINLPRASSSFTHDLIYAFGGRTAQPIVNGAGASHVWTPPLSLLELIPNATQGELQVGAYTKNGSTQVGYKQYNGTLRAPASVVPTVSSVTATDQNPDVVSIVGRFVQGLSRAKFTVNGAGAYGSTITGSEVAFQGQTIPAGTDALITGAGDLPATGKVTDSRGRTGSAQATVPVLAYSAPKVTAYQARRCSNVGVVQDDGTYLRVDLTGAIASLLNGTERNALTVKAFTRPRAVAGGVVQPWTARNVITPGGLTYNTWFLVSGGGIYSTTQSYDVRVELRDKFNVYVADTVVSTVTVTLDLNGPNVGVGKAHERGALDVGPGGIWDDGLLVINTGSHATETARGIVELATATEAATGTDTVRAVTPAGVKAAIIANETPWTDITTFGAGWSATAGYTPQVRRVGNRVDIRGAVTLGSGGAYTDMITVPLLFRPTNSRWAGFVHASQVGVTGMLLILPTGVITIPSGYRDGSPTSGAAIPLAGFWHLD